MTYVAHGSKADRRNSARDLKALVVVEAFVRDRGYSPALREIGDLAPFSSVSVAACAVASLTKQGYLRSEPGRARALAVLRSSSQFRQLHEEALLATLARSIRDRPAGDRVAV